MRFTAECTYKDRVTINLVDYGGDEGDEVEDYSDEQEDQNRDNK